MDGKKSVEDWWKKGWKKLTRKKEVAGRRELQEEEKEEAAKLVSLESGPELWFVKIIESEKEEVVFLPFVFVRNCTFGVLK